jgi:hypothetical protein
MIGWLYRMIVGTFDGCYHKWDIIGEDTHEFFDKARCTKCGRVKWLDQL